MSKPLSDRTHGKNIKRDRDSRAIPPSHIRAAKCQRSKARNAARRSERRAEAEARQTEYASLSDKAKIRRLDIGGFAAKRERAKIAKRLGDQAAA